ncbi:MULTISPECIES: ATPase [unclassified Methylobacterium]|uniref:ATPase n=1 Tax=unclassified Methylobacterium TaxID=2615210 RepID=UPI0011CA5D6A|nr:ATPase [Methylobacterium sp. WL64]TXN03390.1 ATPase [Methylobacterium sp. WL64]
MSEPARTLPPHETGSRIAPGPLRDWLATMKTHSPAEQHGDDRPYEAEPDAKAPRAAEAAWSPRLVAQPEAPGAVAEDADVSELMAENMMLKAKLKLEADRQTELQAILAEEIRALRDHIREEIGSIEDLRAEQEEVRAEREEFRSERERFRQEREHMRAERDRAVTERDGLRAERHAMAAERDALREERDLWRARTEALAQPLFQAPKR